MASNKITVAFVVVDEQEEKCDSAAVTKAVEKLVTDLGLTIVVLRVSVDHIEDLGEA